MFLQETVWWLVNNTNNRLQEEKTCLNANTVITANR